jgi:hypothetical protein
MFHFRSKREIEDLPVRLYGAGIFSGIGTANSLGNMRGLLGAIDIGSCLNIARIKLDVWVHDWSNTGVTAGVPTGVTHNARFRVQRTFERNQFAFLSPVFDWSVAAHSLGDDPVKTYASEAERLADTTLTASQIGLAFKQTTPDPATYWILLSLKTETTDSSWQQLKEPLPRVKAAYASAMGGGILYGGPTPFGPVFPSILFVGTTYDTATGKYLSTADSEFLTVAGNMVPMFEYHPGVIYYDYDPAVTPAPANLFEQLGHTVKEHLGDPDRLLVRPPDGQLIYAYDSEIFGVFTSNPNWPNYDVPPRRNFFTPSPSGNHNDSWFIRPHAFPASLYDFPSLFQDNSGVPYTYTSGTVNAGYESTPFEVQSYFGGVVPSNFITGRHLDFKSVLKLDMDQLAQEDPSVYPPADPARYIRRLNAMF